MDHDLLAELAGYQNELAVLGDDHERASQVRTQIDRVRGHLQDRVDALNEEAQELDDQGADVRAARARVEARRLAEPLEDAAEQAPRHRAVPSRRRDRDSS